MFDWYFIHCFYDNIWYGLLNWMPYTSLCYIDNKQLGPYKAMHHLYRTFVYLIKTSGLKVNSELLVQCWELKFYFMNHTSFETHGYFFDSHFTCFTILSQKQIWPMKDKTTKFWNTSCNTPDSKNFILFKFNLYIKRFQTEFQYWQHKGRDILLKKKCTRIRNINTILISFLKQYGKLQIDKSIPLYFQNWPTV